MESFLAPRSGPRILAASGSIGLCREPRRMWRRYLIGNLEFATIVLRQRIRRALLDTFVHFVNEDRFAAELSELTLSQAQRAPGPPVQHHHARCEGSYDSHHMNRLWHSLHSSPVPA